MAALRRRAAPATPEEVSRHFLALAVIYPNQALTEEQMNLKFQLFCTDLAEIPECVLENACASFRRATNPPNRFFPSPGELLAHCQQEMREIRRLLRGLATIEHALDAAPAIVDSAEILDAEKMRQMRLTLATRRQPR